MHEQLRSFADQRRRELGPPFAVPPGTRRILQAEVDRQVPISAPARTSPVGGWLPRAWPRLAWLGLAVVAVAATVWIWLEMRAGRAPVATLAQAERKAVREAVVTNAVTAMAPAPVALDATRSGPTGAVVPEPAASASPTADTVRTAAPRKVSAPSLAAGAPAPAIRAVRPQAETASQPDLGQANRGTRFVQTPSNPSLRRNFNSPPPPVLNEFQVEPAAKGLRVTDVDGSIYEGSVEAVSLALAATAAPSDVDAANRDRFALAPARAPSAAPGTRAGAPAAARPAPVDAAEIAAIPGGTQQLAFVVTGTNRTLNQLVRLQGFLVFTNALEVSNMAGQAAIGGVASTLPLWLNNSVLQGEAQVGDRTRFEVNAVPAGPSGAAPNQQ